MDIEDQGANTERWIEVYEDAAGEFRWRRKSANGDIVADSGEGYESSFGASEAVEREFPDDPIVFISTPDANAGGDDGDIGG